MNDDIFEGLDASEVTLSDFPEDTNLDAEPEEKAETNENADGQQETASAEQGGENKPAQETTEQEFELTYNGEKVKKTLSEVTSLAQKGMNYEKAAERARREGETHNAYYDAIKAYADKYGKSPEEYLDFLVSSLRTQEEEQLAEIMPENEAKELAQFRAEKKAKQQEEERMKPFIEFSREYPDVKEFPPEVLESIKNGKTPISAYKDFELKSLRAQVAELKKSAESRDNAKAATDKNRTSTPSSVSGIGSGAKKDPFIDGWDA